MRIGIAAEHGGFELKGQLTTVLKAAGYEVADFGAQELEPGDDYPDFVVPLVRVVAGVEATRGLAICGSGVGACVAANKVPGVRAAQAAWLSAVSFGFFSQIPIAALLAAPKTLRIPMIAAVRIIVNMVRRIGENQNIYPFERSNRNVQQISKTL